LSEVAIPVEQWGEFLDAFTKQSSGRPVWMEIHDLETGEAVTCEYTSLRRLELDDEDARNLRINVTVGNDHTLIKHVLFRPSHLSFYVSDEGAGESLNIRSLNTSTTIRFQAGKADRAA
jgi:hypothetical protein